MKDAIFGLLICGLHTAGFGQVEVSVWTDKSTYDTGDTVSIVVTAYNPTTDTIRLGFPSACQSNYRIDAYNYFDNIDCIQVMTGRTIPPLQGISWSPPFTHPIQNSWWPLSVGAHAVRGEVLGHGRSDTLMIFVNSVTSVTENNSMIGSSYLGNNYPNPFNSTTTIPYTIETPGDIVIDLYNSLGQRIRTLYTGHALPGTYTLTEEFSIETSGVYYVRLQMGGLSQTTRLIFSK